MSDALGQCPPIGIDPPTAIVRAEYAWWQRRRAERAELLLDEALRHLVEHTDCLIEDMNRQAAKPHRVQGLQADKRAVEELIARIGAHTKEVKP